MKQREEEDSLGVAPGELANTQQRRGNPSDRNNCTYPQRGGKPKLNLLNHVKATPCWRGHELVAVTGVKHRHRPSSRLAPGIASGELEARAILHRVLFIHQKPDTAEEPRGQATMQLPLAHLR